MNNFLLGVGEERIREMIEILKLFLFFDRIDAYANDGNALFGEVGRGVAQGAALLRAAAGECCGVKPHQRIFVFFVDVTEVERRASVSDTGYNRSGVADLQRIGGGEGKHGEE